VPIIFIGIRWSSSFGDTSSAGVKLATWVLHLANAAFFVICIFAAFDTGFGLRDSEGRFLILARNRDVLLPLYFLGAICIGYFAGYFLLVSRPVMRHGRRDTGSSFPRLASAGTIFGLMVLAPLGLLFKNVPIIRFSNGPMLQDYAQMLTEKLPAKGIILSDNSGPLFLSHLWLARSGKAADYLFLDTHELRSLAYYRFQTRQHPDQWPPILTEITNRDAMLGENQLRTMLKTLSEKHPIYYLHPSFGYYFEDFYPIPHGLVNELKPYSTADEVNAPPLSDADFTENEAFWKEHDAEIRAMLPAINEPQLGQTTGLRQTWMEKMYIPFEINPDALQLSITYSRALNNWGAAAQGMGRLQVAGAHFEESVQLSPSNIVASANLDFNKKLQKGERVTVDDPVAFQERFGKIDNWLAVLNLYGPFDEPTGCIRQGMVAHNQRLEHSAAQNFLRSLALAPEGLLARLWLARSYVILRMPDKALTLVKELKSRSSAFASAAINPADVFQVELAATYVGEDSNKIDHLIKSTVAQQPPDPAILETVVQVSTFYQHYPHTLLALNKELEISPDNITCLINKGFVDIQLTNYNDAISALTRVLSLQPTNTTALFCRAVSYFEMDKLDESQRDYESLQKLNPNAYPAYHGLAEIALRRKDTNAAIRYFQLDLTNAPPNYSEVQYATERLKELKKTSP
jgi:tetratricopeptide (TPR) repeat protein